VERFVRYQEHLVFAPELWGRVQAFPLDVISADGETKEPDKRWYLLGVALAIWLAWLLGTMMGVFPGVWVPKSLSLDFVPPLTFIALARPAIKDYTTTVAALCTGLAAVFVVTLPLNLGLMTAAVVGVLGGMVAEGVAERRWT
jgi:predicted branched-subunit amino acid permease